VTRDRVILVVDDEPDVLALTCALLERWGHKVFQAPSADVGLLILQQLGLAVDLIITDVVMDGELDGIGLATEALKLNPRLRVVYMSGFGGVGALRNRTAPPGIFLPKPWKPAQLREVVANSFDVTAE
jgi:two-component system cell cycle sensor histidine kinase/response regulator CckA